jgi:hypothetical protein
MSWTMVKYPSSFGGVERRYKFSNGLVASVVNHAFSYGGRDGLWELAVLDSNSNWMTREVFGFELEDDVIGYLNDEQLLERLKTIDEWGNRDDD